MKRILLMLLIMAAAVPASYAQKDFVPDGSQVSLRRMGAFTQDNVVQGYYALFHTLEEETKTKGGRKKKPEKNYVLSLLDDELELVRHVKVEGVGEQENLGSSFNGSGICMPFVDYKKKRSLQYVIYDQEGKKLGSYNAGRMKARELSYLLHNGGTESNSYSGTLMSIPGQGFVRYFQKKKKGMRLTMEMIDNTGRRKWSAGSGVPFNKHTYEVAYPMCANENMIVTLFAVRKRAISNRVQLYLSFHETNKGAEVLRLHCQRSEGDNITLPLGVTYDPDKRQFFIYGEYYGPKDKAIKDQSLGLYYQIVDEKGNFTEEKFCEWPPRINRPDSGELAYAKHTVLHKMVRTSDGRVFAVGEQFKKKASPTGAVFQILSFVSGGRVYTNAAAINLVTKDIVVYEFSPSFQCEKVTRLEKDKQRIRLIMGSLYRSSHYLGWREKMMGSFKYSFTTSSDDHSAFSSSFVVNSKRKREKRKTRVITVNYNENKELVKSEVAVDGKPNWFTVLPAKPGHVALIEYYRKEQLLHKRFEKLGETPAVGPEGTETGSKEQED